MLNSYKFYTTGTCKLLVCQPAAIPFRIFLPNSFLFEAEPSQRRCAAGKIKSV